MGMINVHHCHLVDRFDARIAPAKASETVTDWKCLDEQVPGVSGVFDTFFTLERIERQFRKLVNKNQNVAPTATAVAAAID